MTGTCTASVTTLWYVRLSRKPQLHENLQNDQNVLFHSNPVYVDLEPNLVSAPLLKAKMKLEDDILDKVCYPERQRKQCKDVNEVQTIIKYI